MLAQFRRRRDAKDLFECALGHGTGSKFSDHCLYQVSGTRLARELPLALRPPLHEAFIGRQLDESEERCRSGVLRLG